MSEDIWCTSSYSRQQCPKYRYRALSVHLRCVS